jgi:hypothetical protein
LPDLTAQYDQTEARIRATSPRYAALTQPVPLDLKQIQELVLDSHTLLLEYSLGEDRSYLWAVTDSNLMSVTLPRRAEIEKTSSPWRSQLFEGLPQSESIRIPFSSDAML